MRPDRGPREGVTKVAHAKLVYKAAFRLAALTSVCVGTYMERANGLEPSTFTLATAA